MKLFTLLAAALLSLTLSTFTLAQTSPSAGENMLADRHIADMGSTCTDCHGEDDPKGNPAKEMCLDCHESYEALAQSTQGEEMNPHESHMGPGPCEDCHRSHKQSKLICDECHNFAIKTP